MPCHYLIFGDSLKVLPKIKTKVDAVIVDPPYNTGNKDFVYNDNYVDKEDAYRHSKWLSFMSERLRLAKNLLWKEGIIFVSIDSIELAQLKLLMNEIFGEENFINIITWKKIFCQCRVSKSVFIPGGGFLWLKSINRKAKRFEKSGSRLMPSAAGWIGMKLT